MNLPNSQGIVIAGMMIQFIAFSFLRFLMWTISKVFIEFVTILLLFYVLTFFGCKASGILAPRSGIKPTPPALEGENLMTRPPKSPNL